MGAFEGKLPTTPTEAYQLNPDLEKLWPTLDARGRKYVMDLFHRNQVGGSKVDARTSTVNLQKLYGMVDNDQVKDFLEADLEKYPMNSGDFRKYYDLRRKLGNNPSADPRTLAAVKLLQDNKADVLSALGVLKRDKSNEEAYNSFTGAVHIALMDWRDAHRKDATPKDILETIGPSVLKAETVTHWFSKDTLENPTFGKQVPEDYIELATRQAKQAGRPIPTKAEMQSAWLAMHMRQLMEAGKTRQKEMEVTPGKSNKLEGIQGEQ